MQDDVPTLTSASHRTVVTATKPSSIVSVSTPIEHGRRKTTH
jgi:hypothetical protein